MFTVGTNRRCNGRGVSPCDETELEDDEGSGDGPVNIAGVEELPAPSDGGPSLPREHGEVGHRRDTAGEDRAVVKLLLGCSAQPKTSISKSGQVFWGGCPAQGARAARCLWAGEGVGREPGTRRSIFSPVADPARAMKTMVDTPSTRKAMVRAPTPVDPTSSMVVQAEGATAAIFLRPDHERPHHFRPNSELPRLVYGFASFFNQRSPSIPAREMRKSIATRRTSGGGDSCGADRNGMMSGIGTSWSRERKSNPFDECGFWLLDLVRN